MSNGKKRLGGLALAFAAVMAVFAAAGPALADDDDGWRRWNGDREWRWDGGHGGNWRHDMEGWRHNGWRNDGWRNNGWRNDGWRNNGWRNNGRHDEWRWGNNWRNDGRWGGHNWGPNWGNNWRKHYPNYVYVYPQPRYYYQPRPYYHDYYARPSFNFVIPLDID